MINNLIIKTNNEPIEKFLFIYILFKYSIAIL